MCEFPVMLYVMGEERWRLEKDWPLPASRTESRTLYLSKKRPSDIPGDWFSVENANNNYSLVEDFDIRGDDYDALENPVLIHDPKRLHGLNSNSCDRWIGGLLSFLPIIAFPFVWLTTFASGWAGGFHFFVTLMSIFSDAYGRPVLIQGGLITALGFVFLMIASAIRSPEERAAVVYDTA